MLKEASIKHGKFFGGPLLSEGEEIRDILDCIERPALFHLEIQVRVVVPQNES